MIDVKDQDRQVLDPKLRDLLDDAQEDPGKLIVCNICSHVVTQETQAIEVQGAHQHRCTNPHGIEFLVDCYGQALGCDISGERHHADSWFAGYQWRIATCAECQQHLGWYFDRADDFFYGLITDRVQQA